jgi:hypothetical protein
VLHRLNPAARAVEHHDTTAELQGTRMTRMTRIQTQSWRSFPKKKTTE